ncbi:MAG TPA: hypothetical protein DC009_08935 [Porphyromonadaceae bacterium]|nr:hypothetical protein [Porphyromonadaceae bacterium]
MAKTGKQIQGDIRRMLTGSKLAEEVSGGIYRNGYRPRDSRKEDIIVAFTTGIPDQIETGVVTVNIYVPDIDPCGNGIFVEDGRRTEQLEALAQQWADSLTAAKSPYLFRLRQTIYTEEAPEISQHFIVVRLGFRCFGD